MGEKQKQVKSVQEILNNIASEAYEKKSTTSPEYKFLQLLCKSYLIDKYLLAVKEVKKDRKRLGKNKKSSKRKEHLTKLLTPLIDLNKLDPHGERGLVKKCGKSKKGGVSFQKLIIAIL